MNTIVYPTTNANLRGDFAETINLEISTNDILSIVQFLLNNRIPFSAGTRAKSSLNSHSMSVQSNNIKQQQAIETSEVISRNSFTEICDKYLTGKHKYQNSVSATAIAKELGISPQSFKMKFKNIYQKPFYQCYLEGKMKYAATLLAQGYTATAISGDLGYSHPVKFNKMFQKHFGITPKKYQIANYGYKNNGGI
jgi:AraC-like DNA-binding protein